MHPTDCPGWEYSQHPNRDNILPAKSKELLINLRSNIARSDNAAYDTRDCHQYLFSELTPTNFEYFAGNYRGSNFRCLEFYDVMIQSDPRVGDSASCVHQSMAHLEKNIRQLFAALDAANVLPNSQLSQENKLIYLVAAACQVFVEFLRIHPYANGNGHIARFIIFVFLGKYDFWPKKWPLDDRPPDPPYSTLISQYRDGHQDQLEQFVLKCILGTIN